MIFHFVHMWYFIIAKETNFSLYLLQTSGKFPVESSSVDLVVLIWKSLDFPINQLTQEVLRVLKAGGTTLIRKSSQSAVGLDDKVIIIARLCPSELMLLKMI